MQAARTEKSIRAVSASSSFELGTLCDCMCVETTLSCVETTVYVDHRMTRRLAHTHTYTSRGQTHIDREFHSAAEYVIFFGDIPLLFSLRLHLFERDPSLKMYAYMFVKSDSVGMCRAVHHQKVGTLFACVNSVYSGCSDPSPQQ